ncbi:MAG: FAD-dependent oxidoreductase, partial [Pseudomonadota bacterium]
MDTWDVLVIGGAAVGCAVARDAAGRGLRVLLAEAQDLGGDFAGQFALSGMRGLRPMAGREVDRLHRNCPHLTTLAGAPKARYLLRYLRRKPRPVPPINPLRFALLCAVDAAERGATIRMNAPVTDISEDEGFWRADVGGDSVRASLIVDTCGAFEREMGTEVDLHVALVSTGKRPEDCIFSMAYSKEYDVVGTRDAPAEAAYISEKISVPADTMAGYTLDTSKAPLVKVDPTSAADA